MPLTLSPLVFQRFETEDFDVLEYRSSGSLPSLGLKVWNSHYWTATFRSDMIAVDYAYLVPKGPHLVLQSSQQRLIHLPYGPSAPEIITTPNTWGTMTSHRSFLDVSAERALLLLQEALERSCGQEAKKRWNAIRLLGLLRGHQEQARSIEIRPLLDIPRLGIIEHGTTKKSLGLLRKSRKKTQPHPDLKAFLLGGDVRRLNTNPNSTSSWETLNCMHLSMPTMSRHESLELRETVLQAFQEFDIDLTPWVYA